MTRALTHPPDDPRMWRRLVARTHPDAGGDSDLFVWAMSVRDVVRTFSLRAGASPEAEDHRSRRREGSADDAERVPFDASMDFSALTRRALALAEEVGGVYGSLLECLEDCYPATEGPLFHQQRRGASYKQLAALGHAVGMSKAERAQWYSVARAVPLSQRHAGHILGKLQKAKPEAAA